MVSAYPKWKCGSPIQNMSLLVSKQGKFALLTQQNMLTPPVKFCSTQPKPNPDDAASQQQEQTALKKVDFDEYDDWEEPTTAKEKVAVYSSMFLRLSFLVAIGVCAFLTAKELFPGRMNPNSLFSELFDLLRHKDMITRLCGEDVKAFGRDVGRSTEGRRNHIDSYTYTGPDGSNRMRVRFNMKGSKGQVRVFAEVSDRMADNEYVYLIAQNVRTGRVHTFEDERDRLDDELLNNQSDESEGLNIGKFFFKK